MSRISLCELDDCTMLCNVQVLTLPQRRISKDCTVSKVDRQRVRIQSAQLPTELIVTERTVLASVYFYPASEFQGSAQ